MKRILGDIFASDFLTSGRFGEAGGVTPPASSGTQGTDDKEADGEVDDGGVGVDDLRGGLGHVADDSGSGVKVAGGGAGEDDH